MPAWIEQQTELVNHDQVIHLPDNPHKGDVIGIARSFARFGQRKPIVLRRLDNGKGEITAGNSSFRAVQLLRGHAQTITDAGPGAREHAILDCRQQLGSEACEALLEHLDQDRDAWTRILAVWVDEEPEEGQAFALADNNTARLGSDDPALLLAMLRRIEQTEPALLEAASYTTADLKDLTADHTDPPPALPPDPLPDLGTVTTPPPNPEQRRNDWEASSIRSIVLPFDMTLFHWVTAHLGGLRRDMDVASNAEVIVKLIEDRVDATAPNTPTTTHNDDD